MNQNEKQCTLLIAYETSFSKESEIQEKLESKDDDTKIESLKSLISLICGGESFPKLLMPVIKYCLHSENHTLKKLLLLYWEAVDKKNKEGQLLHEMILVCNAMKNNLTHPNEYIRGSTLRFLCRIREAEILESLIPSITANLEHRHSYVRKNAVLTVAMIAEAFPDLIPDAADLIDKFLYAETNPAAKRNAFMMLLQLDTDRAVKYLDTVLQTLSTLGESFQLSVLELIRNVCRTQPQLKAGYLRAIYNLLQGQANSVTFEGANVLVQLSSAPTAVRAAIAAYTHLLTTESDNNIKLIILARLTQLKKRHGPILQEMIMDILNSLSSPNIDIRRKTLELALELVSPRNVDDVVSLLKKELVKTEAPDYGKVDAYRKLLVETMHACAVRFPDVVSTVVTLLLNYLGDDNAAAALDVIYFVREIVQEYPTLREQILSKVIESFDDIKSSEVYRVTLWILGEYCLESILLQQAIQAIRNSIGSILFIQPKLDEDKKDEQQQSQTSQQKQSPAPTPSSASSSSSSSSSSSGKKAGPVVLADGTYASQSAVATEKPSSSSASSSSSHSGKSNSSLRTLLLGGDWFLAACLSAAYSKLILRFASFAGLGTPDANEEIAKGLLYMTALLRYGNHSSCSKSIDPDATQRITSCLRVLLDPSSSQNVFDDQSRHAFATMLTQQRKNAPGAQQKKNVEVVKQADDLIQIRQLKGPRGTDDDVFDDESSSDVSKLVGRSGPFTGDIASKLSRIYQLTGFSDGVYAEAQLTVQDYDIVLDMTVQNKTTATLQNLTVELHTSGDLKVVERPQTYTLAPNGSQAISVTIKLSSTESGIIFGNIVYDNALGTTRSIVVLNNIHMDVIDYISPATCSDVAFRAMWAEFEWENKVAVNTEFSDLALYLAHIIKITNMKCLTPDLSLSGDSAFLAANLYARSMFGEDALMNVSVEKQRSGKVVGYIRIRSKTQGIALSLGDKITARQRNAKA